MAEPQRTTELPEKIVDFILEKIPEKYRRTRTPYLAATEKDSRDALTEKLADILCSVDALIALDQALGACCVGTSCVPNVTQANCTGGLTGVWKGAGSVCSSNLCKPSMVPSP